MSKTIQKFTQDVFLFCFYKQFADVADEVLAEENENEGDGKGSSKKNKRRDRGDDRKSSDKKKRRSMQGTENDCKEDGGKAETKLLQNLLAGKAGVTSAMNHDNIMNGGCLGSQVAELLNICVQFDYLTS